MDTITINNTQLEALCEGLNNNSKLQDFITSPVNVLAAVQAAKAGEWFPSEKELAYAAEACANCNIKVELGRMPELKNMLQSIKDWAIKLADTVKGAAKRIWISIRSRFTSASDRGALLALKWASSPTTAPAVVLCCVARTSTKSQLEEVLG